MKRILLIALVLLSGYSFSQELQSQDKQSNCLKFSSFEINAQPMFIPSNSTDFTELQRIMPVNEPLFHPDLYNYQQTYQNNPLFNFNIKVGMTSKPNRELLMGISYTSGRRNATDFYKSDTKHIDTLLVDNTTFYVDSNFYSSFSYSENSQEIGLDVSYLFRSDQKRYISVFTGIGFFAGASIYSDISVVYNHDSIKSIYTTPLADPYNPYFNPYYNDYQYDNTVERSAKTDPSILFRGYVPVGLNWNLSKKKEFWKHMNFVFQGSFGLEYRYITNVKGYLKPYVGFTAFGLRYTF